MSWFLGKENNVPHLTSLTLPAEMPARPAIDLSRENRTYAGASSSAITNSTGTHSTVVISTVSRAMITPRS